MLYLSFTHTSGNEEAFPSVLIETIKKVVPHHRQGVWQQKDGSDIESAADAFDRLAARAGENSPYTAALKQAVKETDAAAPFAVLERVTGREPHQIAPETAKELFGSDLWLSASQTDSFYRCHFRYFCQYGMRLNTRRIADIDASLFGTFAHYVMEKLLPLYMQEKDLKAAAKDIPAMGRRIHDLLQTYIQNEMGGLDEKPARFKYLLTLVERTCFSLLWFTVNEMAESRFKPADYELTIGQNGIPSPAIPLEKFEGSVHIIGKIDRVDIYQREDTVFVRVVDYKTGSKEFKLSEIPYGINMQMLLYLFAVCQQGGDRYGSQTAEPAGILYLPAKDITLKNAYTPLDESRLHCLRMNGLLLHDADVLSAMDEKGNGTFIPVEIKDNVIQKNNSTVSKKDFALIRELTEKLLVQMAETLLSGDIAAVPCGETNYLPCTYCDYRTICGREESDDAVYLPSQKTDAVLKKLYEEKEDESYGGTEMD
jgi:ATP-dependent helicase/nuclease subunit B